MTTETQIDISGPFSWAASLDVLERWDPVRRHRLRVAGADVLAFPAPERLLRVTAVSGLGAEKVERLHGVARAALDGRLDAERLRALGPEAGPASVLGIRGIGPFWAQASTCAA